MFSLIDANNFYASCERIFRPDLIHRPIVILSNNDGCCIARSEEAKALGIEMAVPFFKIKTLCEKHQVVVFSSNYTLYGDISYRLMKCIQEHWPEMEVYSIDEAFLDLRTLSDPYNWANTLQQKIFKQIGIPTSIGIGATKTLAKAANYLAKRVFKVPVFELKEMHLLKLIPIAAIWGIGRQWAEKLTRFKILTAYDLAIADPYWIRKQSNVVLMKTALELGGMPCLTLEKQMPKKSIIASRSFGALQNQLEPLLEAISQYAFRAVEKLREGHLKASTLSVFLQTPKYSQHIPYYRPKITLRLIYPSDDLRLITHLARIGIRKIFKVGYLFQKAGIKLDDFISKSIEQGDLLCQKPESENFMRAMEQINSKFGKGTIRLAAEGLLKPWAMKSDLTSPAYTTNWKQLPKVKIY